MPMKQLEFLASLPHLKGLQHFKNGGFSQKCLKTEHFLSFVVVGFGQSLSR
jgi:hypothetical protein